MEEGAIPIFRKSVSGEHNKWRVERKGKNWFSFPDFFCLEGFFAEAVAERTRQPESAADVFFLLYTTYVGISSGQFVRFASLARRGLIWPGMPISPLSFLPVFLFSALSAWKV